MRKLATIRQISGIKPIPRADRIEVAVVDGWETVVKKGEFNVGDYALYLEIDSFVPDDLAPFLTDEGKEPKTYNDVKGQRLKSIRLRKQLSQGLLLPLSAIRDYDLSESLGVQLYDPFAKQNNFSTDRKDIIGHFPPFLQKSDQERIQNLPDIFTDSETKDLIWEVTVKMDGSSVTAFCNKGEVGVCSRNFLLNPESEDNHFNKATAKAHLLEQLSGLYASTERSLAVQGELVGPGIQGNPHNLEEHQIYLYNVYDIDQRKYIPSHEWRPLIDSNPDVRMVKVLDIATFSYLGINSVNDALLYAERLTNKGDECLEGVVFKSLTTQHSFKAINNQYLLTH